MYEKILVENEFPREVDGVSVVVIQNIWEDGGVSYSLYQTWTHLNLMQLICDEDYDHLPTDDEVRKALNEQ